MIITPKQSRALRHLVLSAPAKPTPIDHHKPITDTFPEIPRLAYRLIDVEGLGVKEVAGVMAMRPSRVRKALERARKMLAERAALASTQ